MKMAITSRGEDLQSEMDPSFGRAAYFIVVDSETLEYKTIENTQNRELPQGAGIQAGKMIVDNGAEVLITGFCGPKAFKVLENAGIKIFSGAQGLVQEVIDDFKNGKLKAAHTANVGAHGVH